MGFLKEEQRFFFKFMNIYLKFDLDQIRNHESMKNDNGKPHRRSTIKYWIDRLKETGDVQVKDRKGRPRKLNENEECKLIRAIKRYPKFRYSRIRRRCNLTKVCVSTVNRYGLKNGFRKF